MFTYISMLRGINVGGHARMTMKELVTLYQSLSLENVRTYVQSGNVIFNSHERDTGQLANLIEEKVKQMYNLTVSVFVKTPGELQQIIENNPFLIEKGVDNSKLYLTFLSGLPAESDLSLVKKIHDEVDKFVIINTEVYLYCPDGYGRTKFSNDFFEKKLGVTSTTRNWKTVNTLCDIANTRQSF
jgi:uncharacterized protein (DUF1697 family)